MPPRSSPYFVDKGKGKDKAEGKGKDKGAGVVGTLEQHGKGGAGQGRGIGSLEQHGDDIVATAALLAAFGRWWEGRFAGTLEQLDQASASSQQRDA